MDLLASIYDHPLLNDVIDLHKPEAAAAARNAVIRYHAGGNSVESDVLPSGDCCIQLSSYLMTDTPEECLCQSATSPGFESSGTNIQLAI
uniref:Uncharacterized protein n=1 Tax=Physcomitrium patens TaxID=3218 RepID=A0A2K1J0P9_PHYPA|nr:hypothetical protein PHYPA_023002 [Physcomitrium patens]